MPGSRRRQQCAFKEGRLRCRRDGAGSPPFCRPHQLIVAEQAQRAETPRSGLAAMADLVSDFLAGRPINFDHVASAIDNFAEEWAMGGGYGPNHQIFEDDPYHQDTGEFQHERDNRRRAPRDRVYEAPPIVNELAQKRAAVRKAKVALGFAADEPVTLEQVKRRHRELARRFHPDVPGGSLERMQAVNTAVDLLEQSL